MNSYRLGLLLIGGLFFFFSSAIAQQNVGIGTTSPRNSAVLELVSPSNNQGFLMSRLTTVQRLSMALTSADNGLQVYDITLSQFYYWNGSAWSTFSTQGWGLNGNALTDSSAQFLGATTAFPWILKTKNIERLRVTSSGLVGIGTSVPAATFDVNGDINTSRFYKIGANVVLQNQGTNSLYIGQNAGSVSSSLTANTFIGANTGKNATGSYNTLVGESAGANLAAGIGNTLLGEYAGTAVTTGNENVVIGSDAGGNITNSDHVTLVGFRADLGSTVKRVNATAIGYAAQVNADNALVLGGTGANRVNVGIGTITPAFSLDIAESGTANAPIIRLNQNNTSALNSTGIRFDKLSVETWFAGMDATEDDFVVRQGGANNYLVIDDVTGNVGIGVAPLSKLHVKGKIQMEDGSQGPGKTLVSDANGVASWRQSVIYTDLSNLNTGTLTSANATFKKLANVGTFTKQFAETNIELILTSSIYVDNFIGASNLTVELRIDDISTVFGNALSIIPSNSGSLSYFFTSIFGMFPKINVGPHTVSIWVKTNSGTASSILMDPGGYGGKIVVKELY